MLHLIYQLQWLLQQKIRRILITSCYLIIAPAVFSQAGAVYPSQPSWGDTLLISYRLPAPSAILQGGEPVYAKITTWMQDGGYRWYVLPLTGQDTLTQSFVLPPSSASISIRFYTLNKDDEQAGRKMYVYDRSSRVPVAGAYWEDLFSGNPEPYFKKEVQGYPGQYLTYAKYFNVVSMYKGAEESKRIIEELLPVLEKVLKEKDLPDAGLLAALCVGYAKSGKLAMGKTCLLRLFTEFPQAMETCLAFTLYNYEYYKASSRQIEDDIRQQLAFIYKQWPGAALADEANVTYYLSKMPELSVDDFEKVLLPRYQQGRIPYYGLESLPQIYIDRKQKLDSAKAILTRVWQQWQDGSINHQYRLSPGHYSMYAPLLLQKLAMAHLLLQEYEATITKASAGITLLAGSNYEGNFLPDLLAVRAEAYAYLGNLNMALEDYKQLYVSGKTDALDSIRKIFPYCTVKEKTVEAWLAGLQKKGSAPGTASTDLAPDFAGTDLRGRKVQLSGLKGKVVVMNFWSIGCGPCIGEMPALNKLVQKYQGNPKVVFLAITGDEKERLQQFFKKRKFLYTVVNRGGKVSEDYKIESLPVHIVIGKNGTVINRSTGAREDIATYLEGIIRQEL
ncbi:TlpA family protein disulfide reductase [Paraflavitalea soli]|nr:redoxin domain-containing protein [Paraflavitalea soli]